MKTFKRHQIYELKFFINAVRGVNCPDVCFQSSVIFSFVDSALQFLHESAIGGLQRARNLILYAIAKMNLAGVRLIRICCGWTFDLNDKKRPFSVDRISSNITLHPKKRGGNYIVSLFILLIFLFLRSDRAVGSNYLGMANVPQ